MLQKLVAGAHRFQSDIFAKHREVFERLADGQHPQALFITCSDSRINPNLITQTEPGDLFILRNAGNIVPPYGAANGGEGATIEFAVMGLNIDDIIVCGHTHCGAMKGLLHPEKLEEMPLLKNWLRHAEATRQIVREKYHELPEDHQLNAAIQENVLVQIENLRTYPVVAARLASGKLKLHGWVYRIETGQIFAYDADKGQFLPLAEEPHEIPAGILRSDLSI
ncbi:MAG: carbonic anhydrase [Gemmatales bacterium]|nr:carbonic anhydrase [Gemmatales bacterium]MDW8385863.1 carbonic anhydrase [Gemmatales bacterium]